MSIKCTFCGSKKGRRQQHHKLYFFDNLTVLAFSI